MLTSSFPADGRVSTVSVLGALAHRGAGLEEQYSRIHSIPCWFPLFLGTLEAAMKFLYLSFGVGSILVIISLSAYLNYLN